MAEKSRIQRSLDAVAAIAVIAVCSMLLWNNFKSPGDTKVGGQPSNRELPLVPDRALDVDLSLFGQDGESSAPLTVFLFSDFQCPYCRKFATGDLSALRTGYVDSGRARLVFVHVPIETIHPLAGAASKAAVCAGRQGQFWMMHDALFAEPGEPNLRRTTENPPDFVSNPQGFTECMAATSHPELDASRVLAQTLRVAATPTFFFAETRGQSVTFIDFVEGAMPWPQFKAKLDLVMPRGSN